MCIRDRPCITRRFLTMQHTVMYQPVLRRRRVFVTCFLQFLYSDEGKGNDLVKTNIQLVYPKPLLLPLRQQPIFKLVGASDKQRILFLRQPEIFVQLTRTFSAFVPLRCV